MEEDIKELPTENGVYTEIVDSVKIPQFTNEEADNKEQEIIPESLEGGK